MDLIGFGYAALLTFGSILGYKRRGKPKSDFSSEGLGRDLTRIPEGLSVSRTGRQLDLWGEGL